MSEYQYYEFAAIDRPLTEKEMDELGELSSRAEITPTSFTNVYHFGNFRGNPRKMMEKYFDFFVYVANWGTYHTMIRVPKWALDRKQLKPYIDGEVVSLHEAGDNLIVEFVAQEEPGDWVEGAACLPSLRPVRDALLAGDLRPFYLGWLRAVVQGSVDDEEVEPPVPPGLGKLSPALQSLADFLVIGIDLIAAAAEGNQETAAPAGSSQRDFAAWTAALGDRDKNAWLLELLLGDGAKARSEALKAFHESKAKAPAAGARSFKQPGRTVAELLATAERLREARLAHERQRAEKAKADARKKHLDALADREAAAWKEVDALLSASTAKKHATAMTLLNDLRDVAARRGRIDEAQQRIEHYRRRFARRHSLMRRFRDAGL
ncbi:MAG TPA: hypothetical protein VNH11_07545 [Pirellulales bacterium]|nr:hypothetical protein [Pirellulales bacterium]